MSTVSKEIRLICFLEYFSDNFPIFLDWVDAKKQIFIIFLDNKLIAEKT